MRWGGPDLIHPYIYHFVIALRISSKIYRISKTELTIDFQDGKFSENTRSEMKWVIFRPREEEWERGASLGMIMGVNYMSAIINPPYPIIRLGMWRGWVSLYYLPHRDCLNRRECKALHHSPMTAQSARPKHVIKLFTVR